MAEKESVERQVVFAVSSEPGEPLTIVMGITRQAWIRMIKERTTSTFDFQKIGLPVRVIMFAGENHKDVVAELEALKQAGELRGDMKEDFETDFSIEEPKDG